MWATILNHETIHNIPANVQEIHAQVIIIIDVHMFWTCLPLFHNPTGSLLKEEEVLQWLVHQISNDEIEDVTDQMLDQIIDRAEHLAVLFCACHRHDTLVNFR